MLANINKKLKKKLGFSLVEMLAVIAIIAVLVAIIMPVIAISRQKAAAATNAANLRAIEGKISVMRVENPQIFEDTLTKEGMGEAAFENYLDNAGFDWVTRQLLWATLLVPDSAANQFIEYHVYHNTADENGVITISVSPSVVVTDVPTSEEVVVGDMKIPEGIPMTVYISEEAVLATYEYGGNSYSKDDFAYVAENGTFSGTGSGGMTGEDLEENLNITADCLQGKHVFEDGSCRCIHCEYVIHAGYESEGASGHNCTRCHNDLNNHVFLFGSDSCSVCNYGCEHDWAIDNSTHTCKSFCGTSRSHTYVFGYCAICLHSCTHNFTITDSRHDCIYCDRDGSHTYLLGNSCDTCGRKKPSSGGGGGSCVTPDTLITLADGSKKRVDQLTGDEELLIWNLETGALDSAPIMFVDSEAETEAEVIYLHFSDDTVVKVITEHGFWDYDLNKYVYLNRDAAMYIGHSFFKQSGNGGEKVQLVDVELKMETTTAWSPVTIGHLCYFVNDMLSMPGGVGGLFNIFEVNPETMAYDYEAMANDVETYGLLSYEELASVMPLSEDMFNAAGGAYLKISMGKGNLTEEDLVAMITRYAPYFG